MKTRLSAAWLFLTMPGVKSHSYDVIAFGAAGPRVFARH